MKYGDSLTIQINKNFNAEFGDCHRSIVAIHILQPNEVLHGLRDICTPPTYLLVRIHTATFQIK